MVIDKGESFYFSLFSIAYIFQKKLLVIHPLPLSPMAHPLGILLIMLTHTVQNIMTGSDIDE